MLDLIVRQPGWFCIQAKGILRWAGTAGSRPGRAGAPSMLGVSLSVGDARSARILISPAASRTRLFVAPKIAS